MRNKEEKLHLFLMKSWVLIQNLKFKVQNLFCIVINEFGLCEKRLRNIAFAIWADSY
jgi:hypothetical protein